MRSLARGCSAVLVTSAGLITFPAPAAATTFTVNTVADSNDVAPGDCTCSAASGQCTLRAAVEEANASVGTDVISLPAGEYHIGAANLILSDTAEVRGAGAANTIIEQDTFDRIFRIETTATVTISGVTIQGGRPPSGEGRHPQDRLMGGPGRDAMDGGPGRDVCNGGKQRDRARRCEKVRKL